MLESWDCGVVATDDAVVNMPSSSKESKGKDVFSARLSSALSSGASSSQKAPSSSSSCDVGGVCEESCSRRGGSY